jgi:hypothetical protein
MTLVGEILFFILVVVNVATIIKLGWPWTYRQREVSWYLWLTAWSAALFDGTFLFAIVAKASGPVVQALFLLALGLRVVVSAWLLWMIAKKEL